MGKTVENWFQSGLSLDTFFFQLENCIFHLNLLKNAKISKQIELKEAKSNDFCGENTGLMIGLISINYQIDIKLVTLLSAACAGAI